MIDIAALRKVRHEAKRRHRGSEAYEPVVPAFHAWRPWGTTVPTPSHPDACGTCGLLPDQHEGHEERARLAERYQGYDRWELLLVVDALERELGRREAKS